MRILLGASRWWRPGRVAAEPSPEALRRGIEAVISRRAFAPAQWGIEVRGLRSGRVLYALERREEPQARLDPEARDHRRRPRRPGARCAAAHHGGNGGPPGRPGPHPRRRPPRGAGRPQPLRPLHRGSAARGPRGAGGRRFGRRASGASRAGSSATRAPSAGDRRGSDWTLGRPRVVLRGRGLGPELQRQHGQAAPASRRAAGRTRRCSRPSPGRAISGWSPPRPRRPRARRPS